MSVKIDVTGLDEAIDWLKEIPGHIRREVDYELGVVAADIADYARSIAPKRSTHYESLIGYEKLGEMQYAITADAYYSAYIEFGTDPFGPIIPKNAKVLRFEVGGEIIYAMYVLYNPGVPRQLIIHRAVLDNAEKIVEAVRTGVHQAIIEARANTVGG